mgnify:CR=1 FL=1
MENDRRSAFSRQVGGDYYKGMGYEPYHYFYEAQIPHHIAAIIRRIIRYKRRKEVAVDLRKILHEIELLAQLEGEGKGPILYEVDTQALYKFLDANEFTPLQAAVIYSISTFTPESSYDHLDQLSKLVKLIARHEGISLDEDATT